MKSSNRIYVVIATILILEASAHNPHPRQQSYSSHVPQLWNQHKSDVVDHLSPISPQKSSESSTRSLPTGSESNFASTFGANTFHQKPLQNPVFQTNSQSSASSLSLSQNRGTIMEDETKANIFHIPLAAGTNQNQIIKLPISGSASKFKIVHLSPNALKNSDSDVLQSLEKVKADLTKIESKFAHGGIDNVGNYPISLQNPTPVVTSDSWNGVQNPRYGTGDLYGYSDSKLPQLSLNSFRKQNTPNNPAFYPTKNYPHKSHNLAPNQQDSFNIAPIQGIGIIPKGNGEKVSDSSTIYSKNNYPNSHDLEGKNKKFEFSVGPNLDQANPANDWKKGSRIQAVLPDSNKPSSVINYNWNGNRNPDITNSGVPYQSNFKNPYGISYSDTSYPDFNKKLDSENLDLTPDFDKTSPINNWNDYENPDLVPHSDLFNQYGVSESDAHHPNFDKKVDSKIAVINLEGDKFGRAHGNNWKDQKPEIIPGSGSLYPEKYNNGVPGRYNSDVHQPQETDNLNGFINHKVAPYDGKPSGNDNWHYSPLIPTADSRRTFIEPHYSNAHNLYGYDPTPYQTELLPPFKGAQPQPISKRYPYNSESTSINKGSNIQKIPDRSEELSQLFKRYPFLNRPTNKLPTYERSPMLNPNYPNISQPQTIDSAFSTLQDKTDITSKLFEKDRPDKKYDPLYNPITFNDKWAPVDDNVRPTSPTDNLHAPFDNESNKTPKYVIKPPLDLTHNSRKDLHDPLSNKPAGNLPSLPSIHEERPNLDYKLYPHDPQFNGKNKPKYPHERHYPGQFNNIHHPNVSHSDKSAIDGSPAPNTDYQKDTQPQITSSQPINSLTIDSIDRSKVPLDDTIQSTISPIDKSSASTNEDSTASSELDFDTRTLNSSHEINQTQTTDIPSGVSNNQPKITNNPQGSEESTLYDNYVPLNNPIDVGFDYNWTPGADSVQSTPSPIKDSTAPVNDVLNSTASPKSDSSNLPTLHGIHGAPPNIHYEYPHPQLTRSNKPENDEHHTTELPRDASIDQPEEMNNQQGLRQSTTDVDSKPVYHTTDDGIDYNWVPKENDIQSTPSSIEDSTTSANDESNSTSPPESDFNTPKQLTPHGTLGIPPNLHQEQKPNYRYFFNRIYYPSRFHNYRHPYFPRHPKLPTDEAPAPGNSESETTDSPSYTLNDQEIIQTTTSPIEDFTTPTNDEPNRTDSPELDYNYQYPHFPEHVHKSPSNRVTARNDNNPEYTQPQTTYPLSDVLSNQLKTTNNPLNSEQNILDDDSDNKYSPTNSNVGHSWAPEEHNIQSAPSSIEDSTTPANDELNSTAQPESNLPNLPSIYHKHPHGSQFTGSNKPSYWSGYDGRYYPRQFKRYRYPYFIRPTHKSPTDGTSVSKIFNPENTQPHTADSLSDASNDQPEIGSGQNRPNDNSKPTASTTNNESDNGWAPRDHNVRSAPSPTEDSTAPKNDRSKSTAAPESDSNAPNISSFHKIYEDTPNLHQENPNRLNYSSYFNRGRHRNHFYNRRYPSFTEHFHKFPIAPETIKLESTQPQTTDSLSDNSNAQPYTGLQDSQTDYANNWTPGEDSTQTTSSPIEDSTTPINDESKATASPESDFHAPNLPTLHGIYRNPPNLHYKHLYRPSHRFNFNRYHPGRFHKGRYPHFYRHGHKLPTDRVSAPNQNPENMQSQTTNLPSNNSDNQPIYEPTNSPTRSNFNNDRASGKDNQSTSSPIKDYTTHLTDEPKSNFSTGTDSTTVFINDQNTENPINSPNSNEDIVSGNAEPDLGKTTIDNGDGHARNERYHTFWNTQSRDRFYNTYKRKYYKKHSSASPNDDSPSDSNALKSNNQSPKLPTLDGIHGTSPYLPDKNQNHPHLPNNKLSYLHYRRQFPLLSPNLQHPPLGNLNNNSPENTESQAPDSPNDDSNHQTTTKKTDNDDREPLNNPINNNESNSNNNSPVSDNSNDNNDTQFNQSNDVRKDSDNSSHLATDQHDTKNNHEHKKYFHHKYYPIRHISTQTSDKDSMKVPTNSDGDQNNDDEDTTTSSPDDLVTTTPNADSSKEDTTSSKKNQKTINFSSLISSWYNSETTRKPNTDSSIFNSHNSQNSDSWQIESGKQSYGFKKFSLQKSNGENSEDALSSDEKQETIDSESKTISSESEKSSFDTKFNDVGLPNDSSENESFPTRTLSIFVKIITAIEKLLIVNDEGTN